MVAGLVDQADPDDPPVLLLKPDAAQTGEYSKLEVKWKVRPENLDKGAVEYRVTILTDMEEELALREVSHSGKREEKCRFSDDDFYVLSEDALISAKVSLSVIGNDLVERQESEEFVIRFGQPPEREPGSVGKKVRTFSEGLIELEDPDLVTSLADSATHFGSDSKGGSIPLRTPQRGKSFRVYRPPLIHEVEKDWIERSGAIGRWRVKVRASGARAGTPEFVSCSPAGADAESHWDRAASASRRMAERFAASGGGVAQVYDQKSKSFDSIIKEYVLAWAAMLDEGEPGLALANTVEVQTLSGRTIGLIVLPSHPIRVAWHAAYDNLVLHTAFDQDMPPKEIRTEFSFLDGAMFPPFLPGLEMGTSFVFADTLGFHSVGMVGDYDKEPKAAIAILARALGESEVADVVPTVGNQSAQVLANEILKYLQCHDTPRLLHIHALRAGDGLTVARSLGRVYASFRRGSDEDDVDAGQQAAAPAYVLELYPSSEQRGIAGRFIAETREKRRSGAGVLSPDDQWMLESVSLPNGVTLPRLRWARKSEQDPKTAAHLAVAFDTFESRVVPDVDDVDGIANSPLYAFGLLSFFDREFVSTPAPLWRSVVPPSNEGQKHPSDRTHSERLTRMQQAIQRCVGRSLGTQRRLPSLRTEISADKAYSLREIHRLCDWVITLDRNAGIEYFDSPRDNKEIYDAYVIDCVPERQDLGCLQLITSTSNLEEVRNLMDGALDQMGLSQSRRNAEFLMEHLKALSGRLAIRLTGRRAPTSELIALALSHANCRDASETAECWVPLETGFFVPVDDIRDVLPPLNNQKADVGEEKEARPDLIYVSVVPRRGFSFRFIEVKYRRHLRVARSPEVLQSIREQVESLRTRWDDWYSDESVCSSFRVARKAKLARILRFYADKARRHSLLEDQHHIITCEIDRMVEKGDDYSIVAIEAGDRGWILCPEFAGLKPLEISPSEWVTKIFLFGPVLLPDSDFRLDSGVPPSDDRPPDESVSPPSESDRANAIETAPSQPVTGPAANERESQKSPLRERRPSKRHRRCTVSLVWQRSAYRE